MISMLLAVSFASSSDSEQELAGIQNRMPVIIERDNWPLWLGEYEGEWNICMATDLDLTGASQSQLGVVFGRAPNRASTSTPALFPPATRAAGE